MRLYDQAKACMTMKDQVMRRWMLHGNVSRKGYGNALKVGMVAVLRKDIRRLMMTECIMPRVWMYRRSMPTPTRREMHGTEEPSKIWVVEVSAIEYLH